MPTFEEISARTGLTVHQLEDAATVIKIVSASYEMTTGQLHKALTQGAQGDTRQRPYMYRVLAYALPWPRDAPPIADTDPLLPYGQANPERRAIGLASVLTEACELLSEYHGQALDRLPFFARQGTLRNKLTYHAGALTYWTITYHVGNKEFRAAIYIAPAPSTPAGDPQRLLGSNGWVTKN